MRTLILSTFLYACGSWTLTAEIERRNQAIEMRCYRRLLNISYKDHVTNVEVRNRIQNAIGVHDDLLTMVKKRKLRRYGHISRSSGMAKTILQQSIAFKFVKNRIFRTPPLSYVVTPSAVLITSQCHGTFRKTFILQYRSYKCSTISKF